MKTNHVNLVIATPGNGVTSGYLKSLLETINVLTEKNISWTFVQKYSSHVANAREITLSNSQSNNILDSRPLSGKITYDKILWIDSDISWSPEDVLKLYYSDKDVISGGYILSHGVVAIYPELLGPALTYQEAQQIEKPIKVFGAGFGFLCVKSGVFESLPRPWFSVATIEQQIEGKKFNLQIVGEDLSFCKNIAELGFEVWFDPSVKVNHEKTMQITWNGVETIE